MDLVDILINVHPELPVEERSRLEDEIGHLSGVVSACFSTNHPHMMTVAYNPETITSKSILDQVGSRGIRADKVGL